MRKIKFTKGELKRQRDALRQYERYLPTLQLKKQQLQLEILRQLSILDEKNTVLNKKTKQAIAWIGLLSEGTFDIKPFISAKQTEKKVMNIAGVDIPLFSRVIFLDEDYDLLSTPLWVDLGIEALRELVLLQEELALLEEGISILRRELKVATQRVNLFEKVKIPEAEENIRMIRIYIGDQMANAVGRSKIAKRKIESVLPEEILV